MNILVLLPLLLPLLGGLALLLPPLREEKARRAGVLTILFATFALTVAALLRGGGIAGTAGARGGDPLRRGRRDPHFCRTYRLHVVHERHLLL